MAAKTKQLERQRAALLELRHRVLGHVEHVIEAINEDSNSLSNLSSTPLHMVDVAQQGIVADVEVLETQNGMLAEIDEALARIADGSYGTCAECGEDIPAVRLEALPFVTTCTQCAQALQEANGGRPRYR